MRLLRSPVAVLLLLVAATLAAYQPALRGEFVWDDVDYIVLNETLREPGGLGRIWLEPGATDQYYPLVFTSYWIEHRVFGDDTLGYHVVNVLLQAASAFLLWRVLVLLAVPGALLAAFVFALHPVQVESVAWIAERKNVLSGVFFFATALAYLRFRPPTPSPSPTTPRWGWLAAAVALFAAALLAKSATCTLPVALLLVTWWKAGRLDRTDAIALAPLFVLAASLPLLTVWIESAYVDQEGGSGLGWIERVVLAGRAATFYAGKLVWPANLIFIYPRWEIDAGDVAQWLYPAGILLAVTALWLSRRSIGPGPAVAVLLFLVLLAPALGLIDFYFMRYSFVGDHFQYFASAALIALVCAAATRLAERTLPEGPASLRPILGGVVVAVLAVLTWQRSHVFTQEEGLWKDTLTRNDRAWMAWNNLGHCLLERGRPRVAAKYFSNAVALEPYAWEVYGGMAEAFKAIGDTKMVEGVYALVAERVAEKKARDAGGD
ncbi:MAG: hypothetical protein FJ144_17255 [Deltaproteobacteria bacterium]|nr:hypothetical protein [Deltaproteobacteria bacterium]